MAYVSEESLVEAPPLAKVIVAPALSWGSLLAGSVTVLGIHLLLTLLLSGFGLPALHPLLDAALGTKFLTGAGIAWSASSLVALWIGGWVAGRSARARTANLGGLHGLIVWCVVTVVTFLFLSVMAEGGLRLPPNMAVRGLAEVSKAGGATVYTSESPIQAFARKNPDPITSFVEEALAASPGLSAPQVVRARREIGWTLYRLFSQGPLPAPENRLSASKTVAELTSLDQPDAERMVAHWIISYGLVDRDLQAAKAETDRQVQEILGTAAKVNAQAAVWTFVAFVIGALSSIWGGRSGANAAWNATQEELAAEKYWCGE